MPHKKVEFNGGKILMGSDQILEMGANAGFAESFAKGFRAAQDKELLDSIFEDSVISKIEGSDLTTSKKYPWDAASPAYQKPIPPPKKPSPEPMDLTSKRRIALNE
jgi:hypothetical protein